MLSVSAKLPFGLKPYTSEVEAMMTCGFQPPWWMARSTRSVPDMLVAITATGSSSTFLHADDGSHVVDAVGPGDSLVQPIPMQDVGLGKAESGVAAKRLQVRGRTGAQIVHHINLVTVRQVAFSQMRSDESCTSSDQYMHIVLPLRIFASPCRTIDNADNNIRI